MGTIGGKVGLAVGIVIAFSLAVPVIRFIPGKCFFEEGCGNYESIGLAVAGGLVFGLALAGGITTRIIINGLAHRRKD